MASVNASIPIGVPAEQVGVTGRVFVNGWVYGQSGTQNNIVSYQVTMPAAGTYTFETSGAIGACGFALEMNTLITVLRCLERVARLERQHAFVNRHDDVSGHALLATVAGASAGHVHRAGDWRLLDRSDRRRLQSRHVPFARAKRHLIRRSARRITGTLERVSLFFSADQSGYVATLDCVRSRSSDHER